MSEWSQSWAVDSDYGVTGPVGQLWPRLLEGNARVAGWSYSSSGWFLAVVSRPSPEAGAVTGRARHFLEAAVLGRSHKCIALESGLAESTVSMVVQQALARIGVRVRASKAPPMLTVLARAAARLPVPSVRLVSLTETLELVSLLRPELQLRPHLPAAEFDVLLRVIEGQAYAEIAQERGTSQRTVANQIATVSHRLGVSGRAELVTHVVAAAAAGTSTCRGDGSDCKKLPFRSYGTRATEVAPPLCGSFPFLRSGQGDHAYA